MAKTPPVEIVFNRTATARLIYMPQSQARAARDVLIQVAADPGFRHNQLKPLKGVKGGFRFRTGNWRVSFTLDRRAGVLEVFEIAPRGSAHR